MQTNVKKVLEISKTLCSGPTMWSVKVDEVATEKAIMVQDGNKRNNMAFVQRILKRKTSPSQTYMLLNS